MNLYGSYMSELDSCRKDINDQSLSWSYKLQRAIKMLEICDKLKNEEKDKQWKYPFHDFGHPNMEFAPDKKAIYIPFCIINVLDKI